MSRVLIVDDSQAELRLMTHELESAGYEVVTARSGAETLNSVRQTRPDCVLLDVVMPEMDGFETCRRLKADPQLAGIPVLLLTSLDGKDDIVRGLESGASDYVTKPFVSAVLRARIRAALRRKQDRDELIDINEKLEDAERSAKQALNIRNEFLSHVSHELRTPLTTLHQFLSIVLDGLAGELNDEQREYLEICLRNAHQLRSMIADLMDVTRVQHGKLRVTPRPLDLGALVHEVVHGQSSGAAARDIALTAHAEPIPDVLADDVRVRQVLTNLIDNAIKFTSEGGRIEVSVARSASEPEFACVTVDDTGCGVRPEAQRHIFHYMQQDGDDDWRSRKGLGIGLYICRELVTRQGGRIWVESEPGKGSRFIFSLPVFDFESLIAPAVAHDGALREAFGLLRVDVAPADPNATQGLPEVVSRRSYHLVSTGLYPGDVLLPRFFGAGPYETYFAVVATDLPGLESLCARTRKTLIERSGFEPDEVSIRVRGLLFRVAPEHRALGLEQGLHAVAEEMECLTRLDSTWQQDHHRVLVQ